MSSFDRRSIRYLTLALLAIGIGLFCFSPEAKANPAEDSEREARLRAAFIFNFASFTEWPSTNEQEKFRIAIWKNSSANEAAQKELAGKLIKGKPIEVTSLAGDETTAGVKLIIIDSDSGEAALKKFLAGIGTGPTLTVSRFETHCAQGVIVCFQKEVDKLRFKINKGALDKAGLKMSSQLLKLARTVEN